MIGIVKNRTKQKRVITKTGRLTSEQMESIFKEDSNVIRCMEELTKKNLDNYIIGYSSFCYKNCKIGEVYKEESEENGTTYYLITEIISSNMFYCYSIYSR
ncbi:hypothetical protein [Clostridium sp. 1001283B150210_160208_E6]|uniref:hypothetical protein n=1 Tax=Clostridium sp. 1001283B150210_160208_E6 TaxID=2787129 RepID=UPI0018A8EDC0|nr:hypothetical protein [Clostridium sp. 1001283B150210_160208_E6]